VAQAEKIDLIVSVPLDYPTPFSQLVEQVSSLGLTVDRTEPSLKAIMGSATEEVHRRLQEVPGLKVSRARRMGPA
jgi:hypothetical protein